MNDYHERKKAIEERMLKAQKEYLDASVSLQENSNILSKGLKYELRVRVRDAVVVLEESDIELKKLERKRAKSKGCLWRLF